MLAVGAVHGDSKRLLAGTFEAFRFFLIAVRFGDQAVQMRLQHVLVLASTWRTLGPVGKSTACHPPPPNVLIKIGRRGLIYSETFYLNRTLGVPSG